MKEKILKKLQELRNDDLAAMEFAAERSEEMMKAYCNQMELPEQLLGVGVSLADMILNNGGAAKAKSIKEGDIAVTFATDTTESAADLLKCFQPELDRYRKMDW